MMFLIGIIFIVGVIFNRILPSHLKIVVLKCKTIALGTLPVDEITILEWKPLFSLKTFYFHPGEAQEIFHTHSFNAISFLVYGNYMESFFYPENPKETRYCSEPRNRSRLIFIPKNRFHQITKSEGCRTIMLTGPWGRVYHEYKPDTQEASTSTHGRKLVRVEPLKPNKF
jgi:hypothetical protein